MAPPDSAEETSALPPDRLARYLARREAHSGPEWERRVAAAAAQERQARRRFMLAVTGGVAATLVVLMVIAMTARTVLLPEHQARATVTAYFDALGQQEWYVAERTIAPEALQAVPELIRESRPSVPAPSLQILSGHYEPPVDLEILDVVRDGERARVEVTFGISSSSERFDATMELRRADGFTARTMVRWLILNPLGTLDLGTMAEQGSLTCRDSHGDYTQAFCLTINDMPVAEITGRRSAAPPLLPGQYFVALNTPTPSGWEREWALVVVSPGGTSHVDR